MGILVIGSFMMDLVVQTPRAPENGETIIGTLFSKFPGGKGANQAVAAARLGGEVTMAGKVGKDEFGDKFLSVLNSEHINTDHVLMDEEHATGIGAVTVEKSGNNRIVVIPGANLAYSQQELAAIEDLIKKADILILQLEMDLVVIEAAISMAYQHQVPVILNPAPAQELSDELLRKVTYLTPNETEAEILSGITIKTLEDAERAAKVLMEIGVENIILTLADKGALLVNKEGTVHVPGYPVKPVDSVAAGDSFNGALAYGLSSGKPLQGVVRFANAVGALTVTKKGAIPSLPTLEEVEEFIQQQEKNKQLI